MSMRPTCSPGEYSHSFISLAGMTSPKRVGGSFGLQDRERATSAIVEQSRITELTADVVPFTATVIMGSYVEMETPEVGSAHTSLVARLVKNSRTRPLPRSIPRQVPCSKRMVA